MILFLFIVLCVFALAIHYYPDHFKDFFHTIRTTYLKPEISIFELMILLLILLLGMSI